MSKHKPVLRFKVSLSVTPTRLRRNPYGVVCPYGVVMCVAPICVVN